MANVENLVYDKGFDTISTEELSKIASKGGKNSQKVQKEKRTFKKAIEWLANSDIKITKGTFYDTLKGIGIDVDKLDPTQLATIGLWYGAVGGNASNFKTLMEGNNEIEENTSTPTLNINVIDNKNLEKALYEENQSGKANE